MEPLATISDLQSLVGPDVTLDVPSATAVLQVASGIVRDFCNWQISQVIGDTMVVNGSGSRSVMLPTGLITQVHSVTLDNYMLSPITWDGTVAGQFGFTWAAHGWIKRAPNYIWPEGERRITVQLDHGYAVVPDSIIGIVTVLATRAIDNPESVRSRRVAELAEMYDGAALTTYGLSANDEKTLSKYRISTGPR